MNMSALFAIYNVLACTVMPVFSRPMIFIRAVTRIPRKRPASRWRTPGDLPDLYPAPLITSRGLMNLDSGLFRAYTVLPVKRVHAREKTGMT